MYFLVALLLVLTTGAHAAVLCARDMNRIVRLREACRPYEVEITPPVVRDECVCVVSTTTTSTTSTSTTTTTLLPGGCDPARCGVDNNPCTVPRCETIDERGPICIPAPLPEGTPCGEGLVCGSSVYRESECAPLSCFVLTCTESGCVRGADYEEGQGCNSGHNHTCARGGVGGTGALECVWTG